MIETALLRVRKINKRFHNQTVLKDVSFDIYPGKILAIIGPNGAGKTTLLKIISGFLNADTGRILYQTELNKSKTFHLNRIVSPVFGGTMGFYKNTTVEDNMRFFAALQGIKRKETSESVQRSLKMVGLLDQKKKKVSELSVGMLQRLHVACGLMKESPVLVLDEPTNGVDVSSSVNMKEIIQSIANRGIAIVLTSHILPDVYDLADNIIFLHNGGIVYEGSLNEFIQQEMIDQEKNNQSLEGLYLKMLERLEGANE